MSGSKEKKTTFLKQAAILAGAGLLVRFIGFLYRLPLTNLIGDIGNDIYAAGYYVYMFFLIMSSAGLPAAISKMVSERLALKQFRNAHEIFKVSLLVASSAGLFAAVVLAVFGRSFAALVESPDSYYCILTLSPTILIVAVMAVYRGYFQGMGDTVPTAVSQVAEQIFNAVFSVGLAYVFINTSIAAGAAGGTAGTGIGAFAGLLVVIYMYYGKMPEVRASLRRDGGGYRLESRREIAVELVKTAAPIIIGTAIFTVTNLIDLTMVKSILVDVLNFTKEQSQTEYGRLSGKFVVLTTLPVALSTAVATAAIPNIAAAVKLKDKEGAARKINTALRIAMLLSIPAAVGLGVLSDQILLLLFPKTPLGGEYLRIGSVSIIFLALYQILAGVLQGSGNVRVPAIAAMVGALVKIPLNYFLIAIPSLNAKGAVVSTIACYMVASAVNLVACRRVFSFRLDLMGAIIKPFFAAIIMGLSCYVFYYSVYIFIPINALACVISILLGACVYFIYLFIMKGIDRGDIVMMPMGDRLVKIYDSFSL